MEEITYTDTFVFLLLWLWFLAMEAGLFSAVEMLSKLILFTMTELPRLLFERLKPFTAQSSYSQRATLYEFVLSKYIRFSYHSLHNLVLSSRRSFKWFLYYRYYRQSFAKLNDSEFRYYEDERKEIKGVWITSPSRDRRHPKDLVLFYVHGGGFNARDCKNPWMYVEFLNLAMVCLQEQGFRNPAMFIVDYEPLGFSKDLICLLNHWSYVSQHAQEAHLVLCGDGSGGLLSMSLNLFLTQTCSLSPLLPPPADSAHRRPSAVVLISPWTRYVYSGKAEEQQQEEAESLQAGGRANQDFIDLSILQHLSNEQYFSTESSINSTLLGQLMNPVPNELNAQLWRDSFPKYGVLLTYGDEEYLADELKQLGQDLKAFGQVKSSAQPGYSHCWPVMVMFSERCQELREEGVQYICGIINRMLLWNTDSYLEDDALVTVDIEYN